jgi:hypothetical protein
VALGLLGLGFAPAWLTTGVFGSAVSG